MRRILLLVLLTLALPTVALVDGRRYRRGRALGTINAEYIARYHANHGHSQYLGGRGTPGHTWTDVPAPGPAPAGVPAPGRDQPPAPGPGRAAGRAWPTARRAATGTSTPATATTAACSSPWGPGGLRRQPACPTSRRPGSRPRWPSGSAPTPASAPGPTAAPLRLTPYPSSPPARRLLPTAAVDELLGVLLRSDPQQCDCGQKPQTGTTSTGMPLTTALPLSTSTR